LRHAAAVACVGESSAEVQPAAQCTKQQRIWSEARLGVCWQPASVQTHSCSDSATLNVLFAGRSSKECQSAVNEQFAAEQWLASDAESNAYACSAIILPFLLSFFFFFRTLFSFFLFFAQVPVTPGSLAERQDSPLLPGTKAVWWAASASIPPTARTPAFHAPQRQRAETATLGSANGAALSAPWEQRSSSPGQSPRRACWP
jgi:hypothetical protein